MWIRTKFNVIFNLDCFRSIFVEKEDDSEEWGVMAYQIGDVPDKEGEMVPYVFGHYATEEQADYAMNRIYQALHEGRRVYDVPR